MKNFLTLVFALAWALLSCTKNERELRDAVSIANVEYSGCFSNQKSMPASVSEDFTDSLYYHIYNSVLTLHMDKVYACCGLLKDSVVVNENVVSIYIYDQNPKSSACNCICVFKYDYSVVNIFQKNIYFKVYIKEDFSARFRLWKEIAYIDGKD
jgi:hypothetical protein